MRKRAFILLLLPIILLIWTIGWIFLWTGDQTASQKQQPKQDNIHITVQLPPQEQEIAE